MRIAAPLFVLGLAFVSAANADTCSFTIESTDQMTFTSPELSVPASCATVTITLKHIGTQPANVMGHNWVLTETKKMRSVAIAGMNAPENAYVPPDDARVIAHTAVIGGGQSDTITFSTDGMTPGGDYSFFCSYPGHWSIMKGKFVFG